MAVVSIFKKLYLNLIFIVLAILKTIKLNTNKDIYIHIYIFLLHYGTGLTGVSGNQMSGRPMWSGRLIEY